MELNNNVNVVRVLNGTPLTPQQVEENKHLFDPRCFISNEVINEINKLRQATPANQRATLYIHNDFRFTPNL